MHYHLWRLRLELGKFWVEFEKLRKSVRITLMSGCLVLVLSALGYHSSRPLHRLESPWRLVRHC